MLKIGFYLQYSKHTPYTQKLILRPTLKARISTTPRFHAEIFMGPRKWQYTILLGRFFFLEDSGNMLLRPPLK